MGLCYIGNYVLGICRNTATKELMLSWVDNLLQELVQGFDQETAAVVMARITSLKMEIEVIIKCLFLGVSCTFLR